MGVAVMVSTSTVAQTLQSILVQHAESLLLVDDDQPKVLELDVVLHQTVRADHDVDLTALEAFQYLLLFRLRPESGKLFDHDPGPGEPFLERVIMLLRQHGRRHQHGDLPPGERAFARRPHRQFGLAVAHVAAQQTVHRARRLHVRLDLGGRAQLIRRLFERERLLEKCLFGIVLRERRTGLLHAHGLHLQHLERQIPHGVPRLVARLVPTAGIKSAERNPRIFRADVARDQMRLTHRDPEQLVVAEFQHDRLRTRPGGLGYIQPAVPAYPVVQMHRVVAFLQVPGGNHARDVLALFGFDSWRVVLDLKFARHAPPAVRQREKLPDRQDRRLLLRQEESARDGPLLHGQQVVFAQIVIQDPAAHLMRIGIRPHEQRHMHLFLHPLPDAARGQLLRQHGKCLVQRLAVLLRIRGEFMSGGGRHRVASGGIAREGFAFVPVALRRARGVLERHESPGGAHFLLEFRPLLRLFRRAVAGEMRPDFAGNLLDKREAAFQQIIESRTRRSLRPVDRRRVPARTGAQDHAVGIHFARRQLRVRMKKPDALDRVAEKLHAGRKRLRRGKNVDQAAAPCKFAGDAHLGLVVVAHFDQTFGQRLQIRFRADFQFQLAFPHQPRNGRGRSQTCHGPEKHIRRLQQKPMQRLGAWGIRLQQALPARRAVRQRVHGQLPPGDFRPGGQVVAALFRARLRRRHVEKRAFPLRSGGRLHIFSFGRGRRLPGMPSGLRSGGNTLPRGQAKQGDGHHVGLYGTISAAPPIRFSD